MEAALNAHAEAELARDLDATMATLSANPAYEFVAVGWRVDGRAAVREAYRRLFAGHMDRVVSSTARMVAVAPNALCRESYIVARARGGSVTCQSMAVVTFEGDLISGERVYSGPFMAELMQGDLGADFEEVPGVSRIS
jgi:hypothetical protein